MSNPEARNQIPAIVATGEAIGPKRMTNQDMDSFFGAKEGLTDRLMRSAGTGIEERGWVEENDSGVSTLATIALQEALDLGGLNKNEISALWIATSTPDRLSVSTAAIIQDKMRLPNGIIGSTNQDACPGWVLAAQRAATSLTSKYGIQGNHAVIGAEVISRFLDPEDIRTASLFGDAAGATIFRNVEPDEGAPNNLGFSSGIDGTYAKDLGIEAGGSENPPSVEEIKAKKQYLRMNGKVIAEQAKSRIPQVMKEALVNADNFPIEEVDNFVFHQANKSIIEAAAEELNIPLNKCIFTIQNLGNTSAASIPTAIHRGIQTGEIKRNNVVAMASFGAGLGYSAAILPMVGLPK